MPDRDHKAAVVDWQPIETAPKNGQRILGGYAQSQWVSIIHWGSDSRLWFTEDQLVICPTHWAPLPEGPRS